LVEAWDAYRQRYDLEHFFRFGKQRLLMAADQTPVVEHEENWLTLVQLATVQLWLARDLAGVQLRAWERYLPQRASGVASPSQVQRDWERIIRLIGTPAQPPKRRGNAPGRAKSACPERRPRQPVIKKSARTAPLSV
jgi:predicted alpha/beta hydrolase